MGGKKLVLLGILVIAGGAAFVYFDPLDMNLLGMKKAAVVAKPAMPHVVPKAASPARPKAPVTALPQAAPPAPAATSSAGVPKMAAATPAKTPEVAATSKPVAAVAPSPAAPGNAAAEEPVTLAAKQASKQAMTASRPVTDKPPRPKNLDLRHCLDLESDAAIAKCAGE